MKQANVMARDIQPGDRVWDGGCARVYKWVEVQRVRTKGSTTLLDTGYSYMQKQPEALVAVLRKEEEASCCRCSSVKPEGQSCGCWDNHCQ